MKKAILCLVAVLGLALASNTAQATTVTVLDGGTGSGSSFAAHEWPGYTVTDFKNNLTNNDFIGIPNIVSGSFTINSSVLSQISFKLDVSNNPGWWTADKLMPGDIFIKLNNGDLSSNPTWDYIIHNTTATVSNATYRELLQPGANVTNLDGKTTWSVYNVSGMGFNYNDSSQWNNYVMSGVFNTTGPQGGYIWRDGHPVEAKDSALPSSSIGSASLTGWNFFPSNPADIEAIWNLGQGINLGNAKDILVAWGPSCDNDVYFENVAVPNPEPGTVLLMGIGAAGVAFLRRRRNS